MSSITTQSTKARLLSLSKQLLERQGWRCPPPEECPRLKFGDLMFWAGPELARKTKQRLLVVWVTGKETAFDLWLELLGNECLEDVLLDVRNGYMLFQVHSWYKNLDGNDKSSVQELRPEDFLSFKIGAV